MQLDHLSWVPPRVCVFCAEVRRPVSQALHSRHIQRHRASASVVDSSHLHNIYGRQRCPYNRRHVLPQQLTGNSHLTSHNLFRASTPSPPTPQLVITLSGQLNWIQVNGNGYGAYRTV